jgi:lipopolysaccharide export system permease protein
MRILDKYVAKSFLTGYVIALLVLVGLCVVVDLFVNVDEFAELAGDDADVERGMGFVVGSILRYYGAQSMLYYRDLAGIITVVAAVFSLGKMTKNNELVAIMASGISLRRVIVPIIVLSVLLTSFVIINQELIIPRLVSQLIRSHDYDRAKGESYDFWFLSDGNGNLISANRYVEQEETMYDALIVLRKLVKKPNGSIAFKVTGDIKTEKATYNHKTKRWDLENAISSDLTSDQLYSHIPKGEQSLFFESDVTPEDIPIRRQEGYKSLLSSAQLSKLAADKTKSKDQAELISQKHFRITDPIVNLLMLLVALPVLVCRDPKAMKAAVAISFTVTCSCFVIMFICKMVATEVIFGGIRPEFWAWIPVIIYVHIAFIELDSMKT